MSTLVSGARSIGSKASESSPKEKNKEDPHNLRKRDALENQNFVNQSEHGEKMEVKQSKPIMIFRN